MKNKTEKEEIQRNYSEKQFKIKKKKKPIEGKENKSEYKGRGIRRRKKKTT